MEQKLDVCLINFRSHINLRMHYLFMVNFVFDSGFEMFVAYAMFMVESTPHHLIVFLTQQHFKVFVSALPCEFCEASVCRILAARRTSEQWL